MAVLGIDVSAHQPTTPDTTGLEFLFARATYGIYRDPVYHEHIADARAHQLVVGAYHFGRATPSGAKQAQAFLASAGDVDLYVLDLEADGGNPPMSAQQARDFIAAVQATGRKVGLYHSESGYPTLGQDWRWVANWSREPAIRWDFWQYRGSPLDRDKWRGTADELRQFVHGTTSGGPQEGDDMIDTDLSANLYYGVVAKMPAGVPILDNVGGTKVAETVANEALGLIGQSRDALWCLVAYHDRLRFVEKAKVGEFRPRTPPILATGDAFECPPTADPAASIKTAVNAALDHVAPVAASVTAAIAEARIP